MPPPTYLRVRRRRNAGTALTLRVQGLVADPDEGTSASADDDARIAAAAAAMYPQEQDPSQLFYPPAQRSSSISRKRRSVVWRRVSVDEEEYVTQSQQEADGNHRMMMDAILSEDEDGFDRTNDELDMGPRKAKRRRLTLVANASSPTAATVPTMTDTASPHKRRRDAAPHRKKSKQPLPVLSPLARIVDDSLQAVAVGSLTPQQHYNLVCYDDRLTASTVHTSTTQWLAWCNPTVGTLLHTTALWNAPTVAAQVLQQFQAPSAATTTASSSAATLSALGQAVDGQDQTAAQVAQQLGHTAVLDVLQAHGIGLNINDHDDDPNGYVYDVYRLDGEVEDDPDQPPDGDAEKNSRGQDNDWRNEVACWLQNAYWNEEGDLAMWLDDEQHSADSARGPDDDEDSNDEDWQGNDYPDEEYDDEEDGAWSSPQHHYDDDGDYDYAYGME